MIFLIVALFGLILSHILLEWWRSFKVGKYARYAECPSSPSLSKNWPSVSVLVPAWNEASIIIQSMEALNKVDSPELQIIVIAGGADGTYEIVDRLPKSKSEQLILLRQGKGGKNAALNQGLALATGEVIVILDADSIVTPQWLQALIRPLNEGADASCGNYLPMKSTWVSRTEEMEKIAAYLVDGQCILQGSGSIAIRREVLEKVGGFPASVTTGVDWDLDVRLSRAGYPKSFAPDALLSTQRPATLAQFWKNEIRWRRAHLKLLLHHHNGGFWRNLPRFLGNARLYLLFLGVGGGLLAGLLFMIMEWSELANACFVGVTLVLIWMTGRKAALAGKIAAYTGNWRWFKLAWAPALLLCVSAVASWYSLLTLHHRTINFKGPRT